MLNDAVGFEKIFIATGYTDLRRGIDGLASTIKFQFELDPFQKHVLFLFCGKRTDRIKGLVWEGDGFLLLYKRLNIGGFSWPRTKEEAMEITPEHFPLLATDGEYGIRCKMCGQEFDDYQAICDNDQSCITSTYIMRELGRRKGKLYHPVYECPDCDCNAVVYLPKQDNWKCLCCNKTFGEPSYCEDCGNLMPCGLSTLAMSDYSTEDYKYLCQRCASKARESEEYIDYTLE